MTGEGSERDGSMTTEGAANIDQDATKYISDATGIGYRYIYKRGDREEREMMERQMIPEMIPNLQ